MLQLRLPYVWRSYHVRGSRLLFACGCLLLAASSASAQCKPSREYIRLGGRVVAIENSGTVAAPTFSLPSGSAVTPGTATTISAPAGAVIRYNTTPGSAVFNCSIDSGPSTTLQINGAMVINAIASTPAADSPVVTASYTISPLSVAPATLPGGSVGSSYSQSLIPSGGTAPYTFSLATGFLPAGLTLSAGGALSGTPTVVGTSVFSIAVKDNSGATVTVSLALTVSAPSLRITTASLNGGIVGSAYSQPKLTATGGTPPYYWSASGLPTGLTLSTDGTLSGYPSTPATSANVVITVSDSVTPPSTSSATFSITILSNTSFAITTVSLPPAVTGVFYQQTLAATGGTPFPGTSYSWTPNPLGLPSGVTLNAAGTVSGTPAIAGLFTFTATVTDAAAATATKQLSLTVAPALSITTPSPLPGGAVNQAYAMPLSAQNGTAPYSWSLASGFLPPGLSLTCNGGACSISGTPTAPASYTFTLQVADSGSPHQTATRSFDITIAAAIGFSATPFYLYANDVSLLTATQPASWSLSGVGNVIPTNPDAQGLTGAATYRAPNSVSSVQFPRITATNSAGTASLSLTVLPPGGSLAPSSGTFGSGQFTTFTVSGYSPDNWQSPTPSGWVIGNYEMVEMDFSPSPNYAPTCWAEYVPYTQTIYLGDGFTILSKSVQSPEALITQNCAIFGSGSETRSGTQLAFAVPLLFTTAFHGTWNTYAMYTNGYAQNGTGVVTQTGSITINALPVTISVSPTAANIAAGATQQFTATVTNSANTVLWSLGSAVGSISSSGLYTAPPSVGGPQTVTVTATSIADPTKSASATVTVSPSGTVSVSPAVSALPAGQSQQFTATVISPSGTVTWAVSPNIGSISTTGVYTAPVTVAASQTVTVSATNAADSSKSAAATVSLMPGPLRFVPITPCRAVDTRSATGPFGGPQLAYGGTRSFTIPNSACGIPLAAQAYSLNVAVVPSGSLGYLTLWPSGLAQPRTSMLNSPDGRIKSNAAIVPAGAGGAISVFASDATHVVLDINGYFVAATDPSALAFYPVTPCRVADTRNATGSLGGPSITGGQSRTFPILSASTCGIPAAAQVYSLNIAAVPSGPLGYVTAWATGQSQPTTSLLNALTGTVTANAALIAAGTGGSINLFASNTTDVVIDINGYFAPPGTGGLSLYTTLPCRVLDTRLPAGSQPFSGSRDVPVGGTVCKAPATAPAYVLAATVVPPGPLGYLTVWAQGQGQPGVATLNAVDGAVTSNMAIVPASAGNITAFASNPTQLLLDLWGYFAQ